MVILLAVVAVAAIVVALLRVLECEGYACGAFYLASQT